jgi:hypothetical protein
MNLDDFSIVIDDQRYIKPETALDESNAFIQNLRDTQQVRNAEIAQDTYNLGTAVPSNLGGLGGSGSYFNARYQTPQTNSIIADLKASAQAQALSDAMSNELAKAKQRYNAAYKAYSRRRGSSGASGGASASSSAGPNVSFETPGQELSLRYKGTEGSVGNIGATGVGQKREYYFLGSNGQRVPVTAVGSGSNMILETPRSSIQGKDAINQYVQNQVKKGSKLMVRDQNGKVTDMSSGYHAAWGI